MDVSLYRMIPPQAQDSVFVNSVPLMNVISHEIEDIVIENALPLDVYAGFQRFSNFARQTKRYQRLAAVCRRVFVWGVPDVVPPNIPGIEFIPVSTEDELAREWFLVVDSPQFFTALLTREETYGQDLPKGQRRFRGVWTYDQQLVGRAYLLISQVLGHQFRPTLDRDYEAQSKYLVQISNRLVQRQDRIDKILAHSTMMQQGLAQSETPLLILDVHQRVIAASDCAAKLLGSTPAALIEQPLADIADGLLAELTLLAEPTIIALGRPGQKFRAAAARAVLNGYGDPLGWVISLHTNDIQTTTVISKPALPIAPTLQRHLAGMQQLITVMPSLAERQDVQMRIVGQLQRLVEEMQSQVTRVASGELVD
ncbi:hypothetical protein HC891_07395 [Candidatus Gracilibacteria bacterium]|nr:hypothetical protein [Candidatus Gracilibacteria bacterium]